MPVEAFYLPLNENWPVEHEKHFPGGYWIESAYDEDYWRDFRRAAAHLAEHFTAKGWTEPMFEFHPNNKVYLKRDRWYNPRPALRDPADVREIRALPVPRAV